MMKIFSSYQIFYGLIFKCCFFPFFTKKIIGCMMKIFSSYFIDPSFGNTRIL